MNDTDAPRRGTGDDAWWMPPSSPGQSSPGQSSPGQSATPPNPPPAYAPRPSFGGGPTYGPYGGPTVGPAPLYGYTDGHGADHTAPLAFAPVPAPRRSSTWRNRLLAALVLAAVAVGGGVTGAALESGNNPTTVTSAPVPPNTATTQPTQPLARVAAAVQPSVVSIKVSGGGASGEGSGVILRSDGHILTNNHVAAVAANGGSIAVRFSDGKTASASIVGRDPSNDLAVIKADGVSGLVPAAIGSSADLHVGDTVLALGSPLGLEGSVSSGIVSALHRTVDLGGESSGGAPPAPTAVVTDAIQTDAAINPGNSGGPLVDDSGRVVGINTAIASLGSSGGAGGQSGNIGVGFSIPIDQARTIADQLINGQKPSHAQLGISVSDATSGGAQVGELTPNGGAAKAGLQTGDVVTEVDGNPIADADALVAAVRSHKPGDTIAVVYARNGERRTAQVTLDSSN
jgi:putative serine protease PepD